MKGISAVVATYKRKNELERLFNSILANHIYNIELIIVDQNQDGLLDALIDQYKGLLDIKHLKMTEANQSKARNYGASKARYSIVCFPDDDCWFETNSLKRILDYFNTNPLTDLLIINWKQNPMVHTSSFKVTTKEVFTFRSVGYVTYVLFFNNGAFQKLGGFIETIGIGRYIGGGEDSELTFRAASKGYNIYYNAAILVNHKYIPVTTRELPIIRARQRAMGLMYAKYDIPALTILRGLTAPLLKMIFCMNKRKAKEYYNMFIGRKEGYIYGLKNKELSQAA
jgi:glycosyltransferase involved in cell wall biosynthesis